LGVAANFTLQDLDEGEYEALWKTCAALGMNEIDGKAALLLKYGEDKNPDLLRKDLAIEQDKLGVTNKKTAFLPSLSAGWSHSWNGKPGSSFDDSGRFTLSATIPILPVSKRAAEVGKANITLESARLDRQDTRDNYGLSVLQNFLDFISALHQIESDRAALAYAQEYYDRMFERYRLSAVSVSEVSDAEALLSSARSTEITSRFAVYRAWTSLVYLAGEEDEAAVLRLLTEE
jgi:outer membrane protein TolC